MKGAINRGLARATGYQIVRAPKTEEELAAARLRRAGRVDRLVSDPVFVITSVRSGSTLLRVILNSHSQICAPHELHIRTLRVKFEPPLAKESMAAVGLDERKLEHLLWDRVLDRELTASGKSIIVDKTPNMVFIHKRLVEAWPKARFIFLLRHPAAIADSLFRARENPEMDDVVNRVLEYVTAIDRARAALPGPTVRYEQLVAEPERVTKELCSFLGVPWERTMIDYGKFDHGPLVPKLGDWTEKIQTGQIDTNIVVPTDDEIPPALLDACKAWGYVS